MKNVEINGIFLSEGIQNKIATIGNLNDRVLLFNLLGIDTKIDLFNRKIYRYTEEQQIKIDVTQSKMYIKVKGIDDTLVIPIKIKDFLIKDEIIKLEYNIENIEEKFLLELEFKRI